MSPWSSLDLAAQSSGGLVFSVFREELGLVGAEAAARALRVAPERLAQGLRRRKVVTGRAPRKASGWTGLGDSGTWGLGDSGKVSNFSF